MAERPIRLYGIRLSHPVLAVRAMLDRKQLSYRYVELLGGMHPPSLWVLGFRRTTVPAMKLWDGRRVQGSLAIAQALEQVKPSPSLYPADADARIRAEEAERWGEQVLQPVPRRLIRWSLAHRLSQRRWFADVATPFPAPTLNAILLAPLAAIFSLPVGATTKRVRADIAELPRLLDEVDRLLADGVLGGEELGAADFQIGPSVRMLLAFKDIGQLVKGRPAEAFALRVVPEYPDIPAVFPPEWLPASEAVGVS